MIWGYHYFRKHPYQNTLGVFPNFSVSLIQSEQHSAMSSSRVCRGYLAKLLANHWILCKVDSSHQKDSTSIPVYWLYWLVHRMFLSTLILQHRRCIAPCLFIDQPKLSCYLVTLKGGHAGKKCYRKWLLAIDMKPGKWGEMLSERKGWTCLPVLLRKLAKKLPLQIENYLYTYKYWNVYLDVIWVVVIHFLFWP